MLENEETKGEEIQEEVVEDKQEEQQEELTPVEYLEKGLQEVFSEKDEVVEEKQPEPEEPESEEPKEEEEKSEDEEPQAGYEDVPIPQEQVDIARQLGFPDDEIVKMAEKSPERLVNMVKRYKEAPEPQVPLPEVKGEEPEPIVKLEHVKEEDYGDIDPEMARILAKRENALIDKFNKQEEKLASLGERTSEFSKNEQVKESQRIDSIFDAAAEHVPELGDSTALTQSQAATRQELYGMAVVKARTRGISEAQAMEEVIYMYGISQLDLDQLEKEAEERVKEKVNKHKKIMSPRPSGKKDIDDKPEVGKDAAMEHLEEGLKEMFG